jgi:hypothetical protein
MFLVLKIDEKKETHPINENPSFISLSGVPTPTATNFTLIASNLCLDSFKAKASSQL